MTAEQMTDEQIADALREAVGQVNHFAHVARAHGLSVQLSYTADGHLPLITNCAVARPILPRRPRT